MPLKRVGIVGYDADRMSYRFTMMHQERIIDCEISGAALDDLADGKGVRPDERETQFKRLRDTVERVASDIFDQGGMAQSGRIQIFAKHIRNR